MRDRLVGPVWTRRRALATVGALGTLPLVACAGPGATGAAPTPGPLNRAATISYMTNSDPAQLAQTQRTVTEDFAAVQPRVKVELLPTPFGEILAKLQTSVAGGTPPDATELSYPWMISLGSLKALLPLEPFTRQDRAFDFADFYPPYVEAGKYRGTLYGISGAGGPFVNYFSRNMFEAAGLKLPDDTWTWDIFLDAAKRLTRTGANEGAQPGVAQSSGDGAQWGTLSGDYYNWIYSAGGEIVNKDLTKCMLDRPEAIEGLQMWADLSNVHQVAPTPAALQGQNTNDWFRSGRLAMLPSGRFYAFQQLGTASNLRWNVAPLPKKRTSIVHFNANMTGIMAATRDKDAAWAFMAFWEGKENRRKSVRAGSSVPGRKSVAESAEYLESPALPREANKLFTDLMGKGLGRTLPGTPAWTEINTVLLEQLGPLQRGERTAADFARAVVPRIDQLLKAAT